MIKFFRRIRYRLLGKNNTSKYFKYATGEIILVVFGILIALQINNWNQNRINSAKQQDYFIGLKKDLEIQILFLTDFDRFCERLISEGESILTNYKAVKKFSEIDSINKKLTTFMFVNPFREIRTTFNELTSTGQLNLIKEQSLRSEIIKFYLLSEIQKNSINNNIKNVIYAQIFPIIKSAIIIQPENFGVDGVNIEMTDNLKTNFENNLNQPTKEFELLNAISLRIIITKREKESLANTKNEAQNLLNLINNELKMN